MRSLFSICLAVIFTLLCASANAQQSARQIETIENSDYPGFDLRSEKGITLDACKQICIDDLKCKAFTYNGKVKWCFLKSDFRDSAAFKGATAGKIVETSQAALEPDLGAAPPLAFVAAGLSDEARLFLRRAAKGATRDGLGSTDDLMASLRTAMITRDLAIAEPLAADALGSDPQSLANWLEFTAMASEFGKSDAEGSYRMRELATIGAINAYQLTRTASQRADALAVMARALETRGEFRAAINAYSASLEIAASPQVLAQYRELRVAQGFRVTGNSVNADTVTPSACIEFSEDLVKTGIDYSNFVTIDGKPGAIEVSARRICAEGLEHGKSYSIALRAGLPSSVNEALEEPSVLEIYVRDRDPAVRFSGENFVLPGAARQGIPLIGINADTAELQLYRVGDRSLASLLSQSRFLTQLDGYTNETLRDTIGTPIWKGKLDLERQLNRDSVTSLPLDKVLPDRQPGIYVLTAKVAGKQGDDWQPSATQWFLVSDIGLSTYWGDDGLAVATRSLDSAQPVGGVELTLVAVNNEVLGKTTSDANGVARFGAGLLRGSSGMAPAAVTARLKGEKGEDYVFLDLSRAGFDLSDRGVTGRAATGPVDVYTYLDRGIYRLGETVNAMALARDDSAKASESLPLTIVFERPDGVEAARVVSIQAKAGGHLAQYALPANGMRGVWKMLTLTDPDSDPVAEKLFLVEDFVPDRIEFEMKSQSVAIAPGAPAQISIDGRYLYGAPANDLALEGEIRLKSVRTLEAAPGYLFGLAEEEDSGSETRPLADLPRTGVDGKAVNEANLQIGRASCRERVSPRV